MPRARTTTAEDIDDVAKKPRAPRTRKVVVVGDEVTPTVRRRKSIPDAVEIEPIRKAPTPLRETHVRQTRRQHGLFVVLGVCLMLFGIGFGIGLSDRGAIDVVAVVTERNEKINRGEVRDASGNTITKTVGVQNQTAEPNGGLILADPNLVPPPTPVVSSSTATSSDAQATSTVITASTSISSASSSESN